MVKIHIYFLSGASQSIKHSNGLRNHDLHLIAIYFDQKHQKTDTLKTFKFKQVDQFIEWLIKKPLAILRDDYLVVHAGIHPDWSINKSLKLSDKVHLNLNKDPANFLSKMYGNQPGIGR